MPKCTECKKIKKTLLTARNYKGKMKKVCIECYYKIKEIS